ncbi:MAG: isocitrate lyase/PEP mutase family protein [Gemmataceae bacterium]|nr:isocitrate lyase/PEP mutase family protein [Gemmataceae bacterium]MDW8265386.1 isocitrate lyase/PEP mutase family protein [Gemmataceae bacterium]
MTPCRRLRELLARPGAIRSLGAYDVFSARLLEAAGLEMVFLGGFGVSASLLGLPDVGLLTLTEMADVVRRTAERVAIPVVADGDTGHGDLHNVQRTVREFERAGAAGILLEDQVAPKRCGHFAGKAVIPRAEMVLKLRAALDARRDADFVVIARTDARAVEGIDAAIARACCYAEAGADVCFVEAPHSREELARVAHEVPRPQLANMLLGGVTPILSVAELEGLGFKIVVCPIETLLIAGQAMVKLAEALRHHGRVDHLAGAMLSFDRIKELLGLPEIDALRGRLHGAAGRYGPGPSGQGA